MLGEKGPACEQNRQQCGKPIKSNYLHLKEYLSKDSLLPGKVKRMYHSFKKLHGLHVLWGLITHFALKFTHLLPHL
jgi:hypothetical protein